MGPRSLSQLVLVVSLAAACNANSGGKAQPTAKRAGASFALSVEGPPVGQANQELVATVRVTPMNGYKVNLEYPTKLQIKGPAAATPREQTLTRAKAVKHSEAGILFRPAFKISAAGSHSFEGAIRFSVCTKSQCEIKNEKVKWVATAEGE